MKEVRLETERLVLRELRQSDWTALHAQYADPEARRFGAAHRWRWQSWLYVWLLRNTAGAPMRPIYDLAVVLRGQEDAPVGGCSLVIGNTRYGALLGFIMDPRWRARGYATEAARGMLRFAFEELGVEQVSAGCHPENLASRRVLERIGMQYRGDEKRFPGSPRGMPSRAYALTRDEWLARCEETPVGTV
jgi:[ribosomal protein S5]-alanine N-acetyltransferase